MKKKNDNKRKKINIKMNSKKIFLLLMLVLVICMGLLIILGREKDEKTKKEEEKNEVAIQARYILDLDDYKNTVSIKKSKNTLASKYKLGKLKTYETVEETELGETKGKVLFVRSGDMDANIYQSRKKIVENNEDNPPLGQITEYMEKFKMNVMNEMMIDYNTEPKNEKLYGKSQYGFPIPTEESIYVEKRLYSLTYEVKDIYAIGTDSTKMLTYDLNFYMDGNYLVCELVRML